MKMFCEFLREQAMKIINIEKTKNEIIDKEHQESNETAKICHIYQEKSKIKYLEITVIILENIEVLHIAYVIKKILYQKKFLQFCIMDLTMIIILS